MNNWRNSDSSTGETHYDFTGDDSTGGDGGLIYVMVTGCGSTQTAIATAIAVAAVFEEDALAEPELKKETKPFIKPVDSRTCLFFFVEKRKHRWTSGFV